MTDLETFVRGTLGHEARDLDLFERALTHSSLGRHSYERLEFLGDRVLGLVVASVLYERYPTESEGQMSRRYNALVARETCAEIGREIGLPKLIRVGKQAREDRASESDNVVGDVVEALIGASSSTPGSKRRSASSSPPGRGSSKTRAARPNTPSRRFRSSPPRADCARPNTSSLRARARTTRLALPSASRCRGSARRRPKGASKQEAETAAAAALLAQAAMKDPAHAPDSSR